MILSRRVSPAGCATFLAICVLLFLALPSSAQALNFSGASNCTDADFDANLQFLNGPDDYYAIVVNKRNISSQACIFDGPMYGPSLVPDRVEGNPPFGLCYDCENRLPNGRSPGIRPLTLDPGQVVWQRFRWRTTRSTDGRPCLQPQWMSEPVLLVARSLLKKVCSDIEVSRFSLEPFDADRDDGRGPEFKLTTNKNTYNLGEMFYLRVSRPQPISQAQSEQENCPTLYLRQRSPDGATRIDEVQPLAFKGCGQPVLGHQIGDWQSGFDLSSGANSRWEGVGEHAVEVFALAGSADDPKLRFVSSNVLRLQIADPAAISRRWGTRVKGIAADITLDKDTYRVGEDVPLHLAIEDFDADVPVFAWDALWDPCMVVGIEIRDAEGHPLQANERLPNWSICTGHGFGPRPIAKGKIIPFERSLGAEGWLPNHPGTYNVVITWAPCFAPKKGASAKGRHGDLRTYAVVHAMATIHVVGGDTPLGAANCPDVAWPN